MERFERKFALEPLNGALALSLLRQVCRSDPRYPKDRVFSLYFDTPDLDQYHNSASGDHHKDKVRIRWYGQPDGVGEVSVYLELKRRRGFASSKERRRFMVPSFFLQPEHLHRGILEKTTLVNTLAEFGYFPEKPLHPVILISYLRYRFNEIHTGVRVSYDSDIRARMVHREMSRREREIRLPNGVIEVKSASLEMPVMLRNLRIMDLDWSRFSKYGNCMDIFFEEPMSVGRLYPPGKIVLP